MAAINFDKLRSLGYQSIDDLPPGMLTGLAPEALAEIARELPTRIAPVVHEPIDYGKGKAPYRQATIQALAIVEAEDDLPPGGALIEIAKNQVRAAMAVNGGATIADRIADRLDGKPQQSVDIMSVNINATARDLTEAELDEILAKVAEKSVRRLDTAQKSITIDQK